MGMKAKVGLLALLVATVAGAIAFDKFRAKTTSATDQVEPQKSDAPTTPSVAATGGGEGLTPIKKIVPPAPPKPKPEPPKPKPAPPTPKPEAPKVETPLPTDFTKGEPPRPMDPWVPKNPVETVKETPKPEPPLDSKSPVEIVNREEPPKPAPPSGLNPADIIRPKDETSPKPSAPSPEPSKPSPLVAEVPKPSAPEPITPDTYEIAPGDSLCAISQKVYGTSKHWKMIFEANPGTIESPERLVVGRKIKIPKLAAAAPAEPKAAEVAPAVPPVELAGKRIHTVKAGDNLSKISKLYYKESRFWQKIAEANPKLDPHNLKVGEPLVIPELETASAAPQATAPTPSPDLAGKTVHVVVEGDSLSAISKKYYGTTKHWKLIDGANHLSEKWAKYDDDYDYLHVGDKLIIPPLPEGEAPAPGGPAPSTPKPPAVPAELASLGTSYTVQEGDTLSSIAERFLGSPNEWGRIDALNKGITYRDADHLSVGTVIVVPKKAEGSTPAPPKAPAAEKSAPTPKPPVTEMPKPRPEPPALEKVPTPPAAKKDPEPPKKDGGSSTGSKLGIE